MMPNMCSKLASNNVTTLTPTNKLIIGEQTLVCRLLESLKARRARAIIALELGTQFMLSSPSEVHVLPPGALYAMPLNSSM